MKLTLIAPPFFISGQKNKGMPMAPPALEYLAGLTDKVAPDVEMVLIDANKEEVPLDTLDSDLVGFTVLTPQAPWVYRVSDLLRIRGLKTVLGGMHVTALPEEALKHADAIVIGEAEGVWKEVLTDFAHNKGKKIYKGRRMPLDKLPHPKTNLLKPSYVFRSFFTSRGCPYHCSFCSTSRFFGDKVRHRPIADVVNEVASSRHRLFINVDDNTWGINIDRSIELYREMSKNVHLKWWSGMADLKTVQHRRADELLKWARKSGLVYVTVGWESNNPDTLNEFKAKSKLGKNRREAIKKIRDSGIELDIFIVLGGRSDTPDDFQRALEVCDELNVSAHIFLIIPLPGTALYDSYKEYIFPDLEWDKFDGNRAVFQHHAPNMSVENREQALITLREELYTWPRILSKICKVPLKGFPMTHLTSFMFNCQWRSYSRISKNCLKLEHLMNPGSIRR